MGPRLAGVLVYDLIERVLRGWRDGWGIVSPAVRKALQVSKPSNRLLPVTMHDTGLDELRTAAYRALAARLQWELAQLPAKHLKPAPTHGRDMLLAICSVTPSEERDAALGRLARHICWYVRGEAARRLSERAVSRGISQAELKCQLLRSALQVVRASQGKPHFHRFGTGLGSAWRRGWHGRRSRFVPGEDLRYPDVYWRWFLDAVRSAATADLLDHPYPPDSGTWRRGRQERAELLALLAKPADSSLLAALAPSGLIGDGCPEGSSDTASTPDAAKLQRLLDHPTTSRARQLAALRAEYAVRQFAELLEAWCKADARYIRRWIRRSCLRSFSTRQAFEHGKKQFHNVYFLDRALDRLVRRGVLRAGQPAPRATRGRSRSPCWEVPTT
jgi:hypothetical protein